jgi:hypothetical protein
MKLGAVDINPDLGKLSWKAFKVFYDSKLARKVNETAEQVYEKLGGKPPKKAIKKGGE